MAQLVKNLPAIQETWVQSLGQGDPLKKGMATHSSILAWRIPYPVVSRENQPQLEKIQEVLPSRQDEAISSQTS